MTETELFLAYRQAKCGLYQEQHGMGRIELAQSEQRLPSILARLQRRLRRHPGWFTGIRLGQMWVVPKKATPLENRSGVSFVGGESVSRLKRMDLRPHVTPSIEFAIVEILWLWTFGAALEALLTRDARANRLKLRDFGTRTDKEAREPFEFYPTAYREFRELGFTRARTLLSKKGGRCLIATFDLASYYDEIDPSFLVSRPFVDTVAARSAKRGIDFNSDEFVVATRTLIDAFSRYRDDCRSLTGVRLTRGIPIGCLTSKVIANVALSTLDEHVLAQPGVEYYGRYVDDILLVARPQSIRRLTASAIAARFLPLNTRDSLRQPELRLDSAKLERDKCRFRLQQSKLKGYVLTGQRGRDLLDTIERDVRLIASERRAFLHPDGLGSGSPISAFVLGSDSKAPIQVLRDVDKLKVERYAASVAISKVAVGVELLDPVEAPSWCRRQLAPLAEAVTAADHWLEFLDLAFRVLATCMRAGDARTARTIIRRHRTRWRRLQATLSSSRVFWNGRAVRWRHCSRQLHQWLETRLLEEISASIPLSFLNSSADVAAFLKSMVGSPLAVGGRAMGSAAVRQRALLLVQADLRTMDRETDRRDSVFDSERRERTPRWNELSGTVRDGQATADRMTRIDRFLSACTEVGDRVYAGMSAFDVLLMTRPPSPFDVSYRWARARFPLEELADVTNAVRWTRYAHSVARQHDPTTIDIVGPLDRLLGTTPTAVVIVLGNLHTDLDWSRSAAKGKPIRSSERIRRLGHVINAAINHRHQSGRSGLETLLVLPELSLPLRWLRPLAARLAGERLSFIAGLEYQPVPTGVVNEAVGVFAPGYNAAAVCLWPKSLPAREEAKELADCGVLFVEHPASTPLVVHTEYGALSTLICSELLDVRIRGSLRGRVDLLVVPAWNRDTATFDHTIQTTANDLHCYVALSNNAAYSDCRVQVPSKERYERDAGRLICRKQDLTLSSKVDIAALRSFQVASLNNTTADPDPNSFKPIPPGYKFRRP